MHCVHGEYNPSEGFLSGPEEAADLYCKHIKRTQKDGPYAIAGYSLGSTLGFEIAKRLRARGDEVRILASIDYPPFISGQVAHLNWTDGLLHIAFFLDLIDESTTLDITHHLHQKSRDEALDIILKVSEQERPTTPEVDKAKLALTSDVAEAFRAGMTNYEPTKGVNQIDVFVADPPRFAAKNREDWAVNCLPVFHECLGTHARMLNKEYIQDFSKKLKTAMRRRGV